MISNHVQDAAPMDGICGCRRIHCHPRPCCCIPAAAAEGIHRIWGSGGELAGVLLKQCISQSLPSLPYSEVCSM